MFLIPSKKVTRCQERIQINAPVSASLRLPFHVIAGVSCDSVTGKQDRYQYDSNNILASQNYRKIAGGGPMDYATPTQLKFEPLIYTTHAMIPPSPLVPRAVGSCPC